MVTITQAIEAVEASAPLYAIINRDEPATIARIYPSMVGDSSRANRLMNQMQPQTAPVWDHAGQLSVIDTEGRMFTLDELYTTPEGAAASLRELLPA